MLGIKPRSSIRAASALYYGVISPVPELYVWRYCPGKNIVSLDFFFTRVNSYKQNCWSKRTLTILTHSISHTPLRKGTWIHTPKSYQWWVSALTTIASIIWERGWLSNIWKMQALPFEGKCPSPCWRVMHIFSLVYCLCLSFVLFSIEGASSLAKFAELIYIFRIFPFTFKMPLIQCTLYRLTQADRPANQLFRIF